VLERHGDYAETVRRFLWRVPARYNIGVDVCDRHASQAGRPALIWEEDDGSVRAFSFDEIRRLSSRLANVLMARGLARGDRLAVLLPQAPETGVAHVAGFKAGLITVPLFALFGEEALEYRLQDSGARALVTDAIGWEKVRPLRDRLPDLRLVLCIDGEVEDALDFHAALARASDEFVAVETSADDPAIIIYTSGTTGNPKGALHAHRVLLGHLPGVEMPHEFFPQPGDLMWTPADWAWIGGLFDVLMPAWHHGIPVLARRFRKFDPEQAVSLMARHKVRNVFLPPTAIKLMRQSGVKGTGLELRTVASGGETLGGELLDWGRQVFGSTINEFYGQTECNLVVGNASSLMPVKPGSMGRAVPGHRVGIVDADGNELPDGTVGAIAVRRPDPVMFLGYWNKPEATAAKFAGDWLSRATSGAATRTVTFGISGVMTT
jgi:acetyl-CoA synthetase